MSSAINFATITTDEYKNIKDFEIVYGFVDSKFGPCIIGTNDEKLCHIAFHDEGKDNSAIDNMKSEWPNALLKENNQAVKPFADKIFQNDSEDAKLNVLLKGTDLQVNVWKELTKLKSGITTSYEKIAKAIGKPSAIRAVANAISRNRLAYVVPCHRVIQKTGNISKYRWGVQRKKEMLQYEKAI